jgi:hypothetical protein
MWGTEWGEEEVDSNGQFDGAYNSVNGADIDVAWSSLALSSSRAMRTILRMPIWVEGEERWMISKRRSC